MPLFSKQTPSAQIPASAEHEPLAHDTDEMLRFTATGRPMQQYTSSALANTPADLTSVAPQFLPQKFTDDSILTIPIPLSALTPSSPTNPSSPSPSNPADPTTNSTKSKSSFLGKLKGTDKSKGNGKGDFKMVKMTRREYLAYWAKDEKGRYIGTEPEGEGARRLRERGEV